MPGCPHRTRRGTHVYIISHCTEVADVRVGVILCSVHDLGLCKVDKASSQDPKAATRAPASVPIHAEQRNVGRPRSQVLYTLPSYKFVTMS
jgi:hypothetical protein